MVVSMITTKDNPYDPFDDFSAWYLYDVHKGYNTCAYLARVAKVSDALSDDANNEIVDAAIDEIIMYDPFDIYRKVKKEIKDSYID